MNLLNLLLKSLLSESSISALAKKTGLKSAALKKLIPLAIPLLIKFMTNNASSQSGALSLLSALGQHTNNRSLSDQIDDADLEDGSKILGHIFGDQTDAIENTLALQSGLSVADVNNALSGLAPAVLSSLNTATASVSSTPKFDLSDGFDLSDVAGLVGRAQTGSAGSGLLSGLLGGGSASLGGGLLDAFLGSSAQQAESDTSVNGNQLLSLLASLK